MDFWKTAGIDIVALNENIDKVIKKHHTPDNRGEDGSQATIDIEKIAKSGLKTKNADDMVKALTAIVEICRKCHSDPVD